MIDKSHDLPIVRQAELLKIKLRNAMEALTYDRARGYTDELPASEYETWQPRKLLQTLLDAYADVNSTLKFGIEDAPGEPAKVMDLLEQNLFILAHIQRR